MSPAAIYVAICDIISRRTDLSMAADLPALEARDIQREIDALFERIVAEQQPSVKRGQ